MSTGAKKEGRAQEGERHTTPRLRSICQEGLQCCFMRSLMRSAVMPMEAKVKHIVPMRKR